MGLIPTSKTITQGLNQTDQTPVQTVANNIGDVNTVATALDAGTINQVITNQPDIGTVSENIASVVSLAQIDHELGVLAADLSNLNQVAGKLAEIGNVSINMASLLLLHTRMGDLLGIATSLPNIDAVASNEADIDLVALNIPDITNVVSHMASIHYCAQNSVALESLYANINGIIGIASDPDALTTVANNIDVILEAATHVDEINTDLATIQAAEANVIALEASATTSATNASASATSASNSAGVASGHASTASTDAISAEASKNAASTSESNASTSATNAANSAASASSSEGIASAASVTATSAKDAAVVAKNAAETSATNAATSETNSANSASAANTSETNAASSASSASGSASAASISESNASVSAASASTSASNAANSATEAAASADEASIISASVSQAEFEARRAINNEQYAASGFVHFGQHHPNTGTTGPVNEGLTSRPLVGSENSVFLGRGVNAPREGSSKFSTPFVNIAGNISKLLNENADGFNTAYSFPIKFPAAPNGTVTYDSATGTVTDYSTEVDPKYGDVAGTVNEAVARAFEGDVKNGDFRNGTADWTVGTGWSISNGAANAINVQQYVKLTETVPTDIGKKYTLSFVVTEQPTQPFQAAIREGNTSGAYVLNETFDSVGYYEFEFTATKLNSNLAFMPLNAGGTNTTISSVSVRPVTEEVVTDRVDMYGLEGFLEEVNTTNPYIYPNGLIQSQATSMNGITTGASNRPDTYYAMFDGDTTSRGKGVDYFALSEANKIKVLGDPDNNLYRLDDGRLVQWRIRQRTIAGAGNGDWEAINFELSPDMRVQYSVFHRVKPQGTLNSIPNPTSPLINDLTGMFGNGLTDKSNQGAPVAVNKTVNGDDVSVAVNGECYFLVLGTVSRLNQGAYHPSFNPSGTASQNNGAGYTLSWHHSSNTLNSKAECFNLDGSGNNGGVTGGSIVLGSYWVGRPDGRFYDAIYADGLGGVVDYRWSAFGKGSTEEASKVRQAVKNGSYRGLEKVARTQVFAGSLSETGSSKNIYIVGTGMGILTSIGDVFHVYRSDGSIQTSKVQTVGTDGFVSVDSITNCELVTHVIVSYSLNTSVSGDFSTTDVIGDPANILATAALAEGWTGRWIPIIPDGVNGNWPWARKRVDPSVTTPRVFTTDNGTTWNAVGTINTNSITNEGEGQAYPTGFVQLVHYTAFAKQTKPANNAVVLNGESGLGDVSQFARYDYSLLMESLIGKVGVSNSAKDLGSLLLESFTIDHQSSNSQSLIGELSSVSNYLPTHNPVDLVAPTNNSPAVKSLMYQVDSNSQASLNFAYKEMIWDFALDQGSEFVDVLSTDPQNANPVGTYVHITGGYFAGHYRIEANLTASSWDVIQGNDAYIDENGNIWSNSNVLIASKWDGNGWGDDDKIDILDGDNTKTDLNGNTVQYGTHELAIPYGWIKNEV